MSAGLCTICHSPHASSEKYTLRVYGGDMCLMCHEGVKNQTLMPVVHKPVGDGSCTKCHEPHSSQRNDFFVKEEGNKLCLSCHKLDKMTHNHPWGVPPRMEAPIRLDKNGNLLCLSCHRAHASDQKKLVIQGGCAKCHGS
jgi:predicted CXXCH cytochrome family protein